MLVALFASLAIAVAKGVATSITGSAAMAAETAHSVADTANQIFLLTRSATAASRPMPNTPPAGA